MDAYVRNPMLVARRAAILTGLALLFAGVYYTAYLLRFDGFPPAPFDAVLQTSIGLFVALKIAAFIWLGLHRGWGRFATFHDFVTIVEAATLGTFLLVIADRFWLAEAAVPRSVIILDWGGTLIVVCGLRSVGRSFRERYVRLFHRDDRSTPTLIVGAGHAGEALLRSIKSRSRLSYDVRGFVDGNLHRIGETIAGVPILGTLEQTCDIAVRLGVQEVLITAGGFPGTLVRSIVGSCGEKGIRVSMLPSYEQLLTGRLAVRPRDVAIEDLLRREPVTLDTAGIEQWLGGRTLMVTGSAGSIGSEVCRQLLQFAPKRIVLVDRSETGQFHVERQLRRLMPQAQIDVRIADITDARRMRRLFAEFQPEILFTPRPTSMCRLWKRIRARPSRTTWRRLAGWPTCPTSTVSKPSS
ncbi:MAG: polysaccharide biosynthesis protein [Pirellulales bacterium]